MILDRNGRVLVSNVQVFDVFADPALVATADRPQVAGMLAPILQLSSAQILRALNQPNQFDYLAKGVSQDVNDKLQALGLSGIGTDPVRGDRLRALARPRRSRSPRTCSASSTPTVSVSTVSRGTTTRSCQA